ncbi:hypothetical protein CIG75_16765 [Tumebacillus algifaecis]|uniref:HTH cro/C1-type domain-containing protein n=1 Tax=Tumebacillus algifaecis TaxID=1214604 RepID=A0A223D4R7_9BACL|nr:helix-turn-helix transcriptional regulator [Tumebacillus algifaecis]ASS76447.1 hypothetical protein CIG75_16765 [Tumebacillus algifaecis]
MTNTFCERLSALRVKSGLSQQKFADILNLTKSALSNYENGTREPNYATLVNIADNLNVSLDYLLGRTDDPRPVKLTVGTERPFEFPYRELLKSLKDDQYTLGGRPIPHLMKTMIQIPLESIQKIINAFLAENK